MSRTGRLPARIGTIDELLAMAEALEQEAAARYRALSARMARQGDAEMAALFNSLADAEDRHATHIVDRSRTLQGHAPASTHARWELPPDYELDEARGATLDAYRALAFAVRNEERAFAFYVYVAAEAIDPDFRTLAEEMARDELDHAALLRRHRRRAFHIKRPAAVERPESVDALLALARRWDAEAAAAHAALAQALDEAGEISDAGIFRRLAEQETGAAAGTAAAPPPELRNVADGLRLLEEAFDRYVLIGDRAEDERVVAEAQRLAAEINRRLALAGGVRGNTLLDLDAD